MSINRRRLMQGLGASLGAVALRGFRVKAAGAAVYYTHGIASGDPLQDRVILWSRVVPGDGTPRSLEGEWQVAEDLGFQRIVSQGRVVTGASRDFTVKADATGLAAGQNYWYRFIFEGHTSPTGRTKTLPSGTVDSFRVGVCSCSNFPQGYFNTYRDMARSDLDLVMHLGDYIYEYAAGVYANPVASSALGRDVLPGHELLNLEDYRTRYGLYRTDPDLQAAHAAHPWICVWDDHELANNTWKAGAENHNEGEGDFDTRIAYARKAYHEWLPIRTPAQTDQGPIYRSFKVGDLADIIMLDTRLEGRDEQLDYRRDLFEAKRSPEAFQAELLADPQRSLLGEHQLGWFANQLAASQDRGATWQFIGQQVLMGKLVIPRLSEQRVASLTMPQSAKEFALAMARLSAYKLPMNLDAWDGYPASRERVFRLLRNYARNPVVVAGDTHNAWAFNLRDREGRPVGVEVGCPGVNSPGLENYFPLPAEQMRNLLLESSRELVDLDTYRRGWAVITMMPNRTTSHWRFVSTVLSRDFQVASTAPLVVAADRRQFT